MIPAWLSLVLDRMLPDLTGGQRDEMARAIVAAIPLSVLELAVARAAAPLLHAAGAVPTSVGELARRIARDAAPQIAVALLETP